MADPQRFENMAQSQRESLVNLLKGQATDSASYVAKAGDTMTGTLNVPNLVSTGAATIAAGLNVQSTATLTQPIIAGFGTIQGAATIAPIQVFASTASQSVLDFQSALISTASLNLAANKIIGAIKVQYNGQSGYMPIFIGIGS